MHQPTENPFRNYWHIASIAGPAVFLASLLVTVTWGSPFRGWTIILICLAAGIAGGAGAVPNQVKKGNELYDTPTKRRYMVFVYACATVGVAAVVALVIALLGYRITVPVASLIPSLLLSLSTALIVSALLWGMLGRRK